MVRNIRQDVTDLFLKMINRYKRSAFDKWRSGEFTTDSKDKSSMPGAGTLLLQKSLEDRVILQSQLREVIALTAQVSQGITMNELNKENRMLLLKSATFKSQEEGMHHDRLGVEGLQFLYEGDGYASLGNFTMALQMYEAQIVYLRSKPSVNIKVLTVTHLLTHSPNHLLTHSPNHQVLGYYTWSYG